MLECVRELADTYEIAELVHDPWRFQQAALEFEQGTDRRPDPAVGGGSGAPVEWDCVRGHVADVFAARCGGPFDGDFSNNPGDFPNVVTEYVD